MRKIICSLFILMSITSFGQNNIHMSHDTAYLIAIDLADQFLDENKIDRNEYKLIKAENLVLKGDHYKGPQFWYLTYKLKSIIPETENEMLGAGGEIYIEVDVKKRTSKLLGFGE